MRTKWIDYATIIRDTWLVITSILCAHAPISERMI